jgi:hypothetical protein
MSQSASPKQNGFLISKRSLDSEAGAESFTQDRIRAIAFLYILKQHYHNVKNMESLGRRIKPREIHCDFVPTRGSHLLDSSRFLDPQLRLAYNIQS